MEACLKILPFDAASAVFAKLREEGKRIVQCHGTFDLVHPGHIYHFEEARALGDILVVTVTGEKFVNKGPGRPYFNDLLRSKSLAALSMVDYVVVVPFAAAVEAIDCVRPNVYCKGREYADAQNDVTRNIEHDVAAVEKWGGEIHYIGSVVFSSTRLLNNHFDHLDEAVKSYCLKLAQTCPAAEFRKIVDGFSDLKVLVIGDLIFDRYSYVRVQGLTSKNRILSARFLDEETHGGGALAVVRHLRQFCTRVDLLGLTGTEPWINDALYANLGNEGDRIVRDPNFTTVVKHRFVEPLSDDTKELSKLFSVNYIDADPPSAALQEILLKRISECIDDFDVVLVMDFGHGVMQERIRDLVQERASFLALNCQTNSNNHGFNIISHQYRRADCFTLDQNELLLAVARRHIDFSAELENLRSRLSASQAWLTRGAIETVGVTAQGGRALCLPLETVINDTVGAGDAFCSVVSLAAKQGLPIELGTFLGQLAGGQAVKIIGNQTPISKAVLLKSGMSLLSF